MFSTADPLTQGAFTVLICVLMGTCLLVLVAIFRRWQQTQYGCYVASLQNRYRPVLMSLLSGARTLEGMNVLRRLPPAELEVLFDPLFARGIGEEHHLGILLALCTELGLIERWQNRLATGDDLRRLDHAWDDAPGRRPAPKTNHLLQRAKGIRNLGMLRHQPSWPLLVKSLDDPHPDIQSVALRALASIRARGSFPVLLERLQEVVLRDLSAPPRKVLQATLAAFDPWCGSDLLPLLRHENWKLRFLAIDILRGMIYRSAAREPNFVLSSSLLAPEIADLLVTDLWRDASAEVRGRAGEVIAFLPHPRSTTVLNALLFDHEWYVRLHTVHALAQPCHSNAVMLLGLRECLYDSHWRVREAAVTTLLALGGRGRQELYTSFLTSHDQAIRDQVVEVMERQGLMANLLGDYSDGVGGLGALMVEQMADGAAPRGFAEALRVSPSSAQQKFQERFLSYARLKMWLQGEAPTNADVGTYQQSPLEFPPALAA
jgi:HEAT repeat protein